MLAGALLVTSGAFAAESLRHAVAQVQKETDGKILSARTILTPHGPMFRIKVLTRSGRVRIIQVPADVTTKE